MKTCIITHESNGSIRVTVGADVFVFANASSLAESFSLAKSEVQTHTAYALAVQNALNNTPVPTEDARIYRDRVLKIIAEEMPF